MMGTQALPLPNPGDWCTLRDAQEQLKLSRVQVWRLVKSGRLKAYYIGQDPRGQVALVWCSDLDELVRARRMVRGDRGTDTAG